MNCSRCGTEMIPLFQTELYCPKCAKEELDGNKSKEDLPEHKGIELPKQSYHLYVQSVPGSYTYQFSKILTAGMTTSCPSCQSFNYYLEFDDGSGTEFRYLCVDCKTRFKILKDIF